MVWWCGQVGADGGGRRCQLKRCSCVGGRRIAISLMVGIMVMTFVSWGLAFRAVPGWMREPLLSSSRRPVMVALEDDDDHAVVMWIAETFGEVLIGAGVERPRTEDEADAAMWMEQYAVRRPLPAWSVNRVSEVESLLPKDVDPQVEVVMQLRDHATGWPLVALRWREVVLFIGDAAPIRRVSGRLTLPEWLQWGDAFSGSRREMPCIPIWPGFFVNALMYGAAAGAVMFGPGAVRRAMRRRAGRCERCGYPRGDSAVCTECGAAMV